MSLERTADGTFDAHCDGCGACVSTGLRYATSVAAKLRVLGWKRVGHYMGRSNRGGRRPAYLWHCKTCPAPVVTKPR